MLTPEKIAALLADRRPGMVVASTGLSYPTVKAAAEGKPISLTTLLKLSAYFEGQGHDPK